MADPASSLYEALRALEHRAAAARRKADLPSSRRSAAGAARKPPYLVAVDGRRISSWLPEDPAFAQVPRASDADKVWALVRVWSDWAGDGAPQQRYWMDLIDAAQPVRARKPEEKPATRSAYLQQVRRIAPPELVNRETELAELVRFCLDADRGPYAWWQAGAWAGKSALLSTFVLRPEVSERVRIVSFFITARLAAQDTREAFTQVLLEQLADLTGQDLPAVLPEATREAYLLDLLAQAAVACQQAGGRLVLVVDGLDEDRGVTTGPHAHSIAGLLPASPPAGMRVIVAGRPNPPIPDDVLDWHPLRAPGIIRPLPGSSYGRDVQRLSRQELQRLLHGTPVEQDLLGLLTAARGGLSGADLEELTEAPLWDIEEILHTAAGRTFTRRAGRWALGTAPEVYLLGHEELQATASHYLGDQRLAGYHDRLHHWAGAYRARGWPPSTPEYLLSGYFRLLTTLSGDLSRMIACAGDRARHNRMLDLTGGDAAALAEIRTALDLIAAEDTPDLVSALRLARDRDQLTDRNTNIPASLPAVWATLGQTSRAGALAASITDPDRRAEALAQVAGALARAGQFEQAETLARSTDDPHSQALALARIAGALAGTGQHERAVAVAGQAEVLARCVTGAEGQAKVLAEAADVLAAAGQHEQAAAVGQQAATLTASIFNPWPKAEVLAQVAGVVARAGQFEPAETLARSIRDPYPQGLALARIAGELAGAGQDEQALAVAGQAETLAPSITNPSAQAKVLAQVAGVVARAGQFGQAETLARSITGPEWQGLALARVAGELAGAGQDEQAIAVAGQAETLARSVTSTDGQARILAEVAGVLAASGQHQRAAAVAEQAEMLARSITYSYRQAEALAEVAGALARAGQFGQAETLARSITDPYRQAGALAEVAGELAGAGQDEQAIAVAGQAETLARSITDPYRQAGALTEVADVLARSGQRERAAAVAGQAETLALSAAGTLWQAVRLGQVAGVLAAAGQHERAAAVAGQAETLARSANDPPLLGLVAVTLARAGQYGQAETLGRSITEPVSQAVTLKVVASVLTGAGMHRQAEALARSITAPDQQAEALAQVAEALAGAGDTRSACRVAAVTCVVGSWTTAARAVLVLDPSAFAKLAPALDDRQTSATI
jgi:tetratricopeptide (TPR) repeat protein